jgi:tubulin-folding cofactor B
MAAYTMGDLAAYVAGGKERDVSDLGAVLLDVKHNLLRAQYKEIKFSLDMTVIDVKEKIYRMTGSQPSAQSLAINGIPMNIDSTPLRSFNPQNRMVITCTDTDPFSLARGGQLEDTSLVKKYVMSDEDYNKREGTVRKFIERKRAENPDWKPPGFRPTDVLPPDYRNLEQILLEYKIGDRVEVFPGARRGEIMFIGHLPEIKKGMGVEKKDTRPTITVSYTNTSYVPKPTAKTQEKSPEAEAAEKSQAEQAEQVEETPQAAEETQTDETKQTEPATVESETATKESSDAPIEDDAKEKQLESQEEKEIKKVWIGVKFDDPVGRNDGSIRGTRYFTAPPNCGAFVQPQTCTVGDFPEEDPFATSSDEDEEL